MWNLRSSFSWASLILLGVYCRSSWCVQSTSAYHLNTDLPGLSCDGARTAEAVAEEVRERGPFDGVPEKWAGEIGLHVRVVTHAEDA